MRDILLTSVFFILLLRVFAQPKVGAYLWAWMSLMNPHKLTYGFAHSLPFAMLTAAVTSVVFLFTKQRKPFPINSVTLVWLVLVAWMTLSSVFSMNDPAYVWERWIFVFKIHFMMFVTVKLLRGRQDINVLIWIVTFSVCFYGAKGGLWTLLTGGGGRVWGPPAGMIAGNNEIAVALVMMLPFVYYLYQVSKIKAVRVGLAIAGLFTALGILGTQSRGALLALLAMAFMMGLKGKKPVMTSVGVGAAVLLMIAFMPETWTTRMDTIQTYQTDTSAMSRIYTWKTLWNVVKDRPFLGAGFGTDNLPLFSKYGPTDPEFKLFFGKVWVAHSIYFQAMGEHGFVGLGLYLMIGVSAYFMAAKVRRRALELPHYADWVPLLMRMVQVSLVGFAVGGAFLSLMHLDLPYYVIAFVVLVDATMREEAKQLASRQMPRQRHGPMAQEPARGMPPPLRPGSPRPALSNTSTSER